MSEYEGPAGVHFSDEELLLIWQRLTKSISVGDRIDALQALDPIRHKIKRHLERNNVRIEA